MNGLLLVITMFLHTADSLLTRAAECLDRGDWEQSLSLTRQVVDYCETADSADLELRVRALSAMGQVLEETGRWDEAVIYTWRLMNEVEGAGDEYMLDYIWSLADLAFYHSMSGNVIDAARYGMDAVGKGSSYIAGNMPMWVSASDFDAVEDAALLCDEIVRQCFGAIEDGYMGADAALQRQLAAMFDWGAFIGTMRTLYQAMGQMVLQATTGTRKAQVLQQIHAMYGNVLGESLLLAQRMAEVPADGLPYLQELLDLHDAGQYRERALLRMASLYVLSGENDSVRKYLAELERLDADGNYAALICENRACLEVLDGNWEAAFPLLQSGFDRKKAALKQDFSWMSSRSRQRMWQNNYAWYFQQNIDLCATAAHPDYVNGFLYDNILLQKGVLLSTDMELEQLLSDNADAACLDSLYALRGMYRHLQREDNKASDSLSVRRMAAEQYILQQSRLYGDFTRQMDLTFQDVRQHLADDDIAVEFFRTEDDVDGTLLHALLLRKQWAYPKMVTLGKEGYYASSTKYSRCYTSVEFAADVWADILSAGEVKPGERILFAPDGILYLIAIEYLPAVAGQTMCDVYRMHRLSSTRELCKPAARPDVFSAALYGGIDYGTAQEQCDTCAVETIKFLPATLLEVNGIGSLLHGSRLRTGNSGTENSFKDLSANAPAVIHLATHGFYLRAQNAEKLARRNVAFVRLSERQKLNAVDYALSRSGLLLAGANQAWNGACPNEDNDGILTAKEIAMLDLHQTNLVVLSACKTAQGDITADGVSGLQRGFKKAGVRSIIMSLWSVDDYATRLLMNEFYRQVLAGNDFRLSLRLAQQYLRAYTIVEDGFEYQPYNLPRYWAAFIMLD